MSVPVTKSYFCSTSSFTGTTFGALSDGVSPPNTNTTWGWNTGRNNPPLYSEMNYNVEVPRTSSQWLALPTGSIPSQNTAGSGSGNCWIAGPIRGEFLAGNWFVTMSVKSTDASAAHTGQFIYRFWTSPSGSGQNASLITSSFISSSVLSIPNNTTGIAIGTASIVLPNINLRNEYILIQTYWSLLTNPGGGVPNNAIDNDYVLGVTASVVQTSQFVTSRARAVTWEQARL
jgi:hypothetical protein